MSTATATVARPGIDYFVPKPSYTASEVARLCDLSPEAVRSRAKRGELGCYRVPGGRCRIRIPHGALVAYLARRDELSHARELVEWAERLAGLLGGK